MSERGRVPQATISRLPVYLGALEYLQGTGQTLVSSRKISMITGHSDCLIRKDLSWLGEFGSRGTGYDVDRLQASLRKVLGLDVEQNLAIIGNTVWLPVIDHLAWLEEYNVRFVAIFSDLAVKHDVNSDAQTYKIDDLEKVCRAKNITLATVIDSEMANQQFAQRLVQAGIKGIWNFSYKMLMPIEGAIVLNENLLTIFGRLSFAAKRIF